MTEKPDLCSTCAKQVKRLGNKPFFEAITRDGLLELASTLHRYGHENAEAIIDEALIRRFGENGADRVPSSSDLWSLCRTDPADFETRKQTVRPTRALNPNCPRCGGTGWEVIQRGGAEGVIACPAGCPVPACDPNKPAPQPGSTAERESLRSTNAEFLAELSRDLAQHLSPSRPVHAATEADIARIRAIQDTNRRRRIQAEQELGISDSDLVTK